VKHSDTQEEALKIFIWGQILAPLKLLKFAKKSLKYDHYKLKIKPNIKKFIPKIYRKSIWP
jgi:hypothetical protein